LTYKPEGAETLRELARKAAAVVKLPWKETNALVLRRGPYVVAAGLAESVPDAKPLVLKGRFIDLFDPELPVLSTVALSPGKRALLFDLAAGSKKGTRVLAAACRVREQRFSDKVLSFRADGIAETQALVRIAAQEKPAAVLVGGQPLDPANYDFAAGTVRLRFPNSPSGVTVELRFGR
jgi:hypothetical protein